MATLKLELINNLVLYLCLSFCNSWVSYHFARDPDIGIFVLNHVYVSNKVFAIWGCSTTDEMEKHS